MGEVYRAHDTRLDRDVAIKILPSEVASDADRLRRFEQEARAAAALNHPNILSVHDVGHDDGVVYLVTELLEGRTLRDLLGKETLPVSRVVDLAAQIADGLAAAHARGIVHRDIKPDNLFVTTDGRVKILDFGLAKATEVDPQIIADNSTRAATAPHTVLGTLGYMAPEQVRGESVDSRADTFALGCVLYEMLSGRRAFKGTTSFDTMSAILKDAPEPIETTTTRVIPPALVRIVDRCLEKMPAARFQSTTDLAFALRTLTTSSNISAADAGASGVRPAAPRWRRAAWPVLAALFAAAALLLALTAWHTPLSPSPTVSRFVIPFEIDESVGWPAISPDGSTLVYPVTRAGRTLLYVRGIDQFEAKPLPGTEGAGQPFFSPDGKSVGFEAGRAIKKTSFDAAGVITVCPLTGGIRGASWGPDNTIVFTMFPGGDTLWRVSAAGGTPEILGPSHGSQQVTQPQFLPDGRHILYALLAGTEQHLELYSLVDHSVRQVLANGYKGRVLPTGHLVFLRARTLMAVPFDVDRLPVQGTPVRIADVKSAPNTGRGDFDLSVTGSLVFAPLPAVGDRDLVWMTRQGREMPSGLPPGPYAGVALSPDARRVAIAVVAAANTAISIGDLARGTLTRLAEGNTPAWSPDRRHVAYVRDGRFFAADADVGTESEVGLSTTSLDSTLSLDWSPDGTMLAFNAAFQQSDHDIMTLSVPRIGSGSKITPDEPRPFVRTPATEVDPRFSPNGQWLAYISDGEVFVRPVAGAVTRTQVSVAGSILPRWAANGTELFYLRAGHLWAVPIDMTAGFRPGTPHALFALPTGSAAWFNAVYDVAPDGRFLFIKAPTGPAPPPELRVVVNWIEEITRGTRSRQPVP
jgi:Tol biopolymer transport system component